MSEVADLTAEATGETVGEAKWAALRELERRHPGLDKAAVQFEVVAEGERGILGVGYEPARVVAHLRLVRFFLRRTCRGGCGVADGAGLGAAASGAAPFPLEPSSFGGVRELRRSGTGAGVFATSRRVISPCPTVQRFVVTQ